MYIPFPAQFHGLFARQSGTHTDADPNNNNDSDKSALWVIVALSCVCFCVLILTIYLGLRYMRKRNYPPKYIPIKCLKDKWNRWNVGRSYNPVSNASPANRNGSAPGAEGTEMARRTNNTPRREPSIRSIATLPAYSANPNSGEQILAREGERAGMDMVVEYPETAEEEEARREELMARLYEMRRRRREEVAERDARRDARARGDRARLEILREQDRLRARQRARGLLPAAEGSNSEINLSLILELSRGRDRRISSVSYADVGYVRHDGSRVRATSLESDSLPLLSGALPAGPDASNRSSLVDAAPSVHSRGESYSSLRTAPLDPGTGTLTRASSQPHSAQSTLPSTPAGEEGDVGALRIPPPEYDNLDWGDAPPYQSPVSEVGEQAAPSLGLVPTILVDAASPISQSPVASPHPTSPSRSSEAH